MNADTIREWIFRRPFEPFVVRLSNGATYDVRHPENLAVGKNRLAVVDPETDSFAHVALIHINNIESIKNAQPENKR